jgi:N-acyl-D-aspartate/D-glutamate deacylase
MGRLAAEAVQAGALGFTTSRTVAHRSSDGRHTPSLTATADELLGIARAVGATGQGVFQAVADLVDVDAEFSLLRAVAEVSGRPLSISTLQRPEQPADNFRRLLGLIDDAAADGLEIRGQVASRPVGLILSLEGKVHPLVMAPTYQAIAARPLAERVAELRRAEVRDAVLAELADPATDLVGRLGQVFAWGDTPRYDPDPSDALDVAAAYDALLADDGRGTLYVPIMNFVAGDLSAVREMLVHPRTVPGLGDAGAHCTMICDASFPTHLLQYWGRDVADEQRLPVEWIVQQQAAATAALVGLHDRGVLAPGRRADVNLIDLDALAIGSPEMLYDLPAGGKRLVQRVEGYRATLVAGEVIRQDGEDTGALPGSLVRGARG